MKLPDVTFAALECNPTSEILTCKVDVFSEKVTKKTEVEKLFKDVKCAENADDCLSDGVLVRAELFQNVKMTEKKEGPCATESSPNCPANSKCFPDQDKPLQFTCKCDPDTDYKDTFDSSRIENAFARPVCQVKTCKDQQKQGGKTWEEVCKEDVKKMCKVDGKPKCVCTDVYVEEGNTCREKNCTDIGPNGISYNSECQKEGKTCVAETNRGVRCICKLGYKEDGNGMCVAQKCEDIKDRFTTWDAYCSRSNENCVSASHRAPRCATCKTNFQRNEDGKCINALTCQDKHSSEKTWDQFCADNRQKCFKPKGEQPVCIEADCDSMSTYDSGKTWNVYCADKAKGKCVLDKYGKPDCECNPKYKFENGLCKAQSCSGYKEPGKTWSSYCLEALGNRGACKEPIRTVQQTTLLECVCTDGYKVQDGECKPKTCQDVKFGELSYTADCASQQVHKICFAREDRPPICVAKDCSSIFEEGMPWSTHCEKYYLGKCEQDQNGSPNCVCKPGEQMREKCTAMKCPRWRAPNATEECAETVLNGHCQLKCNAGYEADGSPMCILDGYYVKWNFTGSCKAKKCPDPWDKKLETTCKSKELNKNCRFSCSHGYKLKGDKQEVELGCRLNYVTKEVVWDSQPECIRNDRVMCENLLVKERIFANGSKCKNAENYDTCTVKCQDKYSQVNERGERVENKEVTVTCKETWHALPECKVLCEIQQYKSMCDNFGLTCNNEATTEDDLCLCNSEYLKWVPGKGCVFWDRALTVDLVGIIYSESDAPVDLKDMEEKLAQPLQWNIMDLGSFKVRSCTIPDTKGQVNCNVDLFFTTFVEISDVKTELVWMKDNCKRVKCDVNFTDTFAPEKLKDAAPVCNAGRYNCGKYHDCIDDQVLSTAFSCRCKRDILKPATFSGNQDPNIMVREACEDIDECEMKVCDERTSECLNIYGGYKCICKENFIPHDGKCVAFCYGMSSPTNGISDCQGNKVLENGECKFTCDSKHTLKGQSSLICQDNGTWNGQAPLCEANPTCSSRSTEDSSKTWEELCKSHNRKCVQTEFSVFCGECLEEFKDHPTDNTTCIANPTCSSQSSEDPSKTWEELCKNQNRKCVQTEFSVFCGACLEGFKDHPRDNNTCIAESSDWCPDLVTPTGGLMAGNCVQARPGEKCLFVCEAGRKLVGESILLCQEKGSWNFKEPTCTVSTDIADCQSLKKGTSQTWSDVCERDNRACVSDPKEGPKCGCQQGLTEICLCTKKRQLLQGFLSYIIQGRNNRYVAQIEGGN